MFTGMKLAHVILTHGNPDQVIRMIGKLSHEDADFYLHVDKKTDIKPYLSLIENFNVFFVSNRVNVHWGGYSIVQATINSFEEVLASNITYDYINLLSGQDYPIKSNADIHKFFSENPGKIFMHYLSLTDEWQEAVPRITQYHLINYNLPVGTYRMEQLINFFMPRRSLPEGMVAMGKSQWFTATPESIAFALQYIKENTWISKFFKLTWAPDEIIFQTILYNSPFRAQMVNNNLLYTDWSKGGASPKQLNMNDADILKKSEKLFARKFNMAVDKNVLNYIDKITT